MKLVDDFLVAYELKYEHVRPLKPGQDGPVFVAFERATGAQVVVKIVSGRPVGDGEREFSLLRFADSRSVVNLLTVEPFRSAGDASIYYAVVTRLVDGGEWGAVLERARDSALSDVAHDRFVLSACQSLASAVVELHGKGLPHGAISERNVLVGLEEHGKLARVILIDAASDVGPVERHAANDVRFTRKLIVRAIDALRCRKDAVVASVGACQRLDEIVYLCKLYSSALTLAPQDLTYRRACVEAAAEVACRAISLSLATYGPWFRAFFDYAFPLFGVERADIDLMQEINERLRRATVTVEFSAVRGADQALFGEIVGQSSNLQHGERGHGCKAPALRRR